MTFFHFADFLNPHGCHVFQPINMAWTVFGIGAFPHYPIANLLLKSRNTAATTVHN